MAIQIQREEHIVTVQLRIVMAEAELDASLVTTI
jgi:hypothetical protein